MHKINFFTLIAFIYSFNVLTNNPRIPLATNQSYIPAIHGTRWDAPPAQIQRLSLPGGKIETTVGSKYPYTYMPHKQLSMGRPPLSPVYEHLKS
jgi:hypothetical protein